METNPTIESQIDQQRLKATATLKENLASLEANSSPLAKLFIPYVKELIARQELPVEPTYEQERNIVNAIHRRHQLEDFRKELSLASIKERPSND